VLVGASRDDELCFFLLKRTEVREGEDAFANTRDACATQIRMRVEIRHT
jgi:hypothetical protein